MSSTLELTIGENISCYRNGGGREKGKERDGEKAGPSWLGTARGSGGRTTSLGAKGQAAIAAAVATAVL